jgi:site-specific DNA-methyltransferase (adenine-specific)
VNRFLNQFILGNALTVLRQMPENSVQCCVTSPPYWGLRDYQVEGQLGSEESPEEYITKMVEVFGEVRRVLRADGTLWLNIGDSYNAAGRKGHGTRLGYKQSTNRASAAGTDWPRPSAENLKEKDLVGIPWLLAFALRADGWFLRQDIIWNKPNAMPESVKDRCTKCHEYLFLLSKSKRYYYNADAIKEPASHDTHARYARGRGDSHKYADGGPGNQTIARSLDHMLKPAGWHNSELFEGQWPGKPHLPDNYEGSLPGRNAGPGQDRGYRNDRTASPKVESRDRRDRASASYRMGREPGWRKRAPGVTPKSAVPGSGIKANESFHEAIGDLVDTRNKRSVWSIPSEGFSDAHFATFPKALVTPCIQAGSRIGDVVIDPFAGTFTTAIVARNLGRNFVMIELSPEYLEMGTRRYKRETAQLTFLSGARQCGI